MGTRIYVGNLPFSADESAVRSLFEQNERKVEEVKLITDRDTGRPRGFAIVEMMTDEGGSALINVLNGQNVDGREIMVAEAKPRRSGGSDQAERRCSPTTAHWSRCFRSASHG